MSNYLLKALRRTVAFLETRCTCSQTYGEEFTDVVCEARTAILKAEKEQGSAPIVSGGHGYEGENL